MNFGKRIFAWHHWCGLIAGAFLLMMSISGSILVFSDEIEHAYHPHLSLNTTSNAHVTFDASFNKVRELYPGWDLRLYEAPKAGSPVAYQLRQKGERMQVFLDPVSGAVLQVTDKAQNQLQNFLLTLHYTLFAGTPGQVVILLVGIVFFICIITGLYIYRKAILKVLLFKVKLNRNSSHAFYSSLHRLAGVYGLLFLLLVVSTGTSIAIRILSAKPEKGRAGPLKAAPRAVYIDKSVASLRSAHPDFTIGMIAVPADGQSVQIRGRFRDDPFYYGSYYSLIVFDAGTGKPQRIEALRDQPFGKKWMTMVSPLHFGNYGGLPVKIIYSILGLTPGLLSITGFVIWRKRKNFKRRRQMDRHN